MNASKYCGSVLKNDFVALVVVLFVVVVLVADELLSNFQGIFVISKILSKLVENENLLWELNRIKSV